MKELFNKFRELQKLANERGSALLIAKGLEFEIYKDSDMFEINDDDSIELSFMERTNHDCPERSHITLTLEQLEMNEEDWKKYIIDTTTATKERLKKQKEASELEAKNRKLRQLAQLKIDLGIE